MKKLFLTLHCTVLCIFITYGQDMSRKNMYWENPYQYNPAWYGGAGTFVAGFQSSVAGKNDTENPRYSLLNVGGEVFHNFSLGATFSTETQANFNNTFTSIAFAYSIGNENSRISMGLSVGYLNSSLGALEFTANPFNNPNDPFLQDGGIEVNRFFTGTGVLYQWNDLNVSLGFPLLLQDGGELTTDLNAIANYTFALSYNVDLIPVTMVEIGPNGINFFDFNTMVQFNDTFWILAGYRSESRLNTGIGIAKNFLRVGYTYSPAIGDYKEINAELHEIMLRFSLGDHNFKQAESLQKRKRSVRSRRR